MTNDTGAEGAETKTAGQVMFCVMYPHLNWDDLSLENERKFEAAAAAAINYATPSSRADSDERTAGEVLSPEAVLAALDRFTLQVLSRDVEPREDDTWAVIDTKTADPMTNWPGELAGEYPTHAEARVGLMKAALAVAAGQDRVACRKLCPSCQGSRGGMIGESGGSPDWDNCWTCNGEGFVPAQPAGAVPDSLRALSEALADLTDAFLSRHGCFPLDQTNDEQRHWHRAMTRAYELVGQPNTPQRKALLASHPAGQSAGSGADGWLPIETAPRDGTYFDAWAVQPETGAMGVRFSDVQMRGDGSGFGIVIHRPRAHWEYLEQEGPTFPAWKLTHWRPRPAGPGTPAPDSTRTGQAEDWRDDPSADVRWNAGLVYGQDQLCRVLGVDPDKVSWDAATETLDGDVQSVICNILRAWAGDDWQVLAARPAAPEAQGLAKIIAAKCKEVDAVLGPDPWKTRKHVGGIYIASKTAHAPRWRQMRADGLPIISTWIDEAGKGETACFTDLWQRCVDEASSADAVIVYREPGEVLKGAFVEVGAALAVGAPVYAIGCDEFSFVHHGGVTRCADLHQALDFAAPPASSGQGGR